jgi:hypothetical protein
MCASTSRILPSLKISKKNQLSASLRTSYANAREKIQPTREKYKYKIKKIGWVKILQPKTKKKRLPRKKTVTDNCAVWVV